MRGTGLVGPLNIGVDPVRSAVPVDQQRAAGGSIGEARASRQTEWGETGLCCNLHSRPIFSVNSDWCYDRTKRQV
jgi:hypothetical protein